MTWLNIGEMIGVNSEKYSDKLALKDVRRQLTFKELDVRTNKLANGLLKLGLEKGDKIAILSNNSLEFMEVYASAAKAGLVVVPINFRLHPEDIWYIIENSESKILFVESRFREVVSEIWKEAPKLGLDHIERVLISDEPFKDWTNYEDIVMSGEDSYPDIRVTPEDTWVILYTSGTTGKPKGAIRSHRSYIAFFLINLLEFSFKPQDYGMILMPLSHVNSTFYSFVFTYIGAPVYVHREYQFDAEEVLKVIHEEKITFTSMIPTHYNIILSLPDEVIARYDITSIRSLLTSSAPATEYMKHEVIALFDGVDLFEAYGSTEAGLVTILRPEDQMTKLGSIGRECIGLDCIRLLDENRVPVPEGEIGELFSRGPQLFDGYLKMPEKTEQAFHNGFFSAGDMARKDKDGFYYLVDRKANMIISGGEHVFPSEVEKVLLTHPDIIECAVVGLYDYKWGEAVTAVCVLADKTAHDLQIKDMQDFCHGKLARFKVPKRVIFIKADDMPKTASGKIVHRLLKDRFNPPSDD